MHDCRAVTDTVADAWRARLRAALAEPLARRATAPEETRGIAPQDGTLRCAGVLIPIVGAAVPYIHFTERSAALRRHAGQISFPGGRMEASDANACAAALRESQEEIGLDPARVEVLGELPSYRTVTGFVIHPFVGWVDPAAEIAPDRSEVARLFPVPLAWALDIRNYERHAIEHGGHRYRVHSIDYGHDHIWGATAGMLYGLVRRLNRVETKRPESSCRS